jgi:hypothetical protein
VRCHVLPQRRGFGPLVSPPIDRPDQPELGGLSGPSPQVKRFSQTDQHPNPHQRSHKSNRYGNDGCGQNVSHRFLSLGYARVGLSRSPDWKSNQRQIAGYERMRARISITATSTDALTV